MAEGLPKFRVGTSIANLTSEDFAESEDTAVFKLRQIGYAKSKEKAASAEALFMPVSMDYLTSPEKRTHIATRCELPPLPAGMDQPVNGVPPYLIINVMLPTYESSFFAKSQSDGPTVNQVHVFLMKPDTRHQLENIAEASAAVKLLKAFIEDDSEGGDYRERLKLMCNCFDAENSISGWAVRNLVVQYNMKPVLTRPQHEFHTDNKLYFEIDIDVHLFPLVTKKSLPAVSEMSDGLTVDLGFTVEGRFDDELPETMLCIARIDKIDWVKQSVDLEEHCSADTAKRVEDAVRKAKVEKELGGGEAAG